MIRRLVDSTRWRFIACVVVSNLLSGLVSAFVWLPLASRFWEADKTLGPWIPMLLSILLAIPISSFISRGGLTKEQQAEYLDFIVEESERLSKLASNVLLISRYENQKLVAEQTDYDLDEQIRTSVLRLESQWAPRGLIFELDLPRLPYRNNSEMMEHVWTNLISNAVKFSRNGGAIFISGTQENGRIIVTVRDEGAGIRPQDLGHIFDKFYQGDSSRVSVGNGLGLALVHRIVELSGGSITAESTLGKGSTFRLELPVHPTA